MNYFGSLRELTDAIGAVGEITSVTDVNPNLTKIRVKDAVVNWHPQSKKLYVQGKRKVSLSLEENLIKFAALSTKGLAAEKSQSKSPKFEYRAHKSSGSQVAKEYVPDSDSELVIALVGAVGTDLGALIDILKARLKTFDYETNQIKISDDIIGALREIPEQPYFDRTNSLMTEGNNLRKGTEDNSVLAKLSAAKINEIRQQGKPVGNLQPIARRAFIISSLKHPDEVAALRKIYANGFFLIGVHANREMRYEYLNRNKNVPEDQVTVLLQRDEDEEEKYGQHTRDTYHLSDFFVDFGENRNKFEKDVWRILDLIFGKPFVTPTFDEFAMFMAFSASLRSADLSRQVGAVVTQDHSIISTGANDVPRFGGGLYWPDYYGTSEIHDTENGRDYIRSGDTNVIERNDIISGILEKLSEAERPRFKEILASSKLKNITEYGRVVHAEMEAILSCARGNIGTQGANLYCTTFPCHNCAKHIIAAGITKVVYVEPYPKSKASEFHDDSISLEISANKKVIFEPFVGVGPRSFFNLFSVNLGTVYEIIRKTKDGKPVEWKEHQARLRMQMLPTSYIERESITTNYVNKLLEKLK
jgi:deoxycytidylate deaminase